MGFCARERGPRLVHVKVEAEEGEPRRRLHVALADEHRPAPPPRPPQRQPLGQQQDEAPGPRDAEPLPQGRDGGPELGAARRRPAAAGAEGGGGEEEGEKERGGGGAEAEDLPVGHSLSGRA